MQEIHIHAAPVLIEAFDADSPYLPYTDVHAPRLMNTVVK
jgi:hypothetical protein